jgi:hypothetical protein
MRKRAQRTQKTRVYGVLTESENRFFFAFSFFVLPSHNTSLPPSSLSRAAMPPPDKPGGANFDSLTAALMKTCDEVVKAAFQGGEPPDARIAARECAGGQDGRTGEEGRKEGAKHASPPPRRVPLAPLSP